MRIADIRKVGSKIWAVMLIGALLIPIAAPIPVWAYDLQLPPPPPKTNFRLTAESPLLTSLANLGGGVDRVLAAFTAPKLKSDKPEATNDAEAVTAKERLEKTVKGIDTQLDVDKQKIKVGQVISLSGIPVDKNHNPVNGLSVRWQTETPEIIKIISDSQAIVLSEGMAKLSVSVGTIRNDFSLTAEFDDDPPEIMPVINDQQANEMVLPENNLGNVPGQMDASSLSSSRGMRAARTREKYGSSNYSFDIPFASLPGRGINASVGMTYNSRVWDKSSISATYSYNADQNWLAPGFEVGLGSIQGYSGGYSSGYLLNNPDGGRTQLIEKNVSGSCTTYESTDGTFVQANRCGNFNAASMTAKYTDGTEVTFGAVVPSTGKRFPIKITDRNGNYTSVAYVANDTKGKIAYIKDTLERYITFHYDTTADQKLVAVTVPGFNNSTTPHQTIRFYYEDIPLNWSGRFEAEAYVSAPTTIKVLRNVYFPGTQSGYRYEYSSYYGVIYKISQRRGMQVSTDSLTETGTVTNQGTEAVWTHYNYAATAMELGPPLTDVPKYDWRKDDWLGRTSNIPETTFRNDENVTMVNGLETGTRTITVTAPDGSRSISVSNVNQAVWDNGLIQEMRKVTFENNQDRIWAKTKMYWQQGDTTGGRQNPRLLKVESTNDAGQIKATSFEYDNFNNQTVVREHDIAAEGTLGIELRRSETTYETGTNWTDNRLIRLPKTMQMIVNNAVVSKVKYEYDNYQGGIVDAPGVMQHNRRYNPYNPATLQVCRWECNETFSSYNGETDGANPNIQPSCPGGGPPIRVCEQVPIPIITARGNVTKVIAFPDTSAQDSDPNNSVQTMKYDITGNVVEASASCCNIKSIQYDAANNYAYPVAEIKGIGAEQMTMSVTYDRNTGLVKTATDENNQTASVTYDPATLRTIRTDSPNGAWSTTEYNDTQFPYSVKSTASLDANRSVSSWTYSNGAGQGFRSRSQTSGGYISSDVEFDIMGRAVKSYSPYTVAALTDVRPSGIKYSEVVQMDGLGRTLQTRLTDMTTVTASYNGFIFIATDQAGKSRRSIGDVLGRIIRVDEPDTNGNLGDINSPVQPTYYEYDGNDNLAKVIQSDGTVTQERLFKYDSLSRLTHEKQVEATPTLDNNGVKQTSGGVWTGVYKYDNDSLLLEGVDARGVKTAFTYDGLNRVKTITYTGETGYQTPNAVYTYDQAENGFFNHGRLTKVQTVANATYGTPETIQNYDYDKMGQAVKHIQSIGSESYQLEYGYNLGGQLVSEKYPSGKIVNMSVDNFGRLATIADSQRTYVSGVAFNNQGILSQINLGNGTHESYTYNDRFQMTSQNLIKSSNVLQKYDYSYGQTDVATGAVDATKNNGQLGKIESIIGANKQWSQRFGYDELGRLSEAREYKQGDSGQLTYRQKFDFDRFGNLYRKAAGNATAGQQNPLPFTPIEESDISKSTNRFTSNTTYNEAGQVVNDTKFRSMSFGYDANGRTVKAAKANTPDAWTVYDALGNRVATKVNDVWQFMIYDAFGKLVAEYGSEPGATATGSVVNSVKYIHQDWQGSVRTVTNNAGFVLSRTDHQAFGEEISAGIGLRTAQQGFNGGNSATRQGYGLTEKDASSGLNHTWFRKQESSAGRWTSPDPYKGSMSLGNPQSFNRYAYVSNDPVNFVDPSGLFMLVERQPDWSGFLQFLLHSWERMFENPGQQTDPGGSDSGGSPGSGGPAPDPDPCDVVFHIFNGPLGVWEGLVRKKNTERKHQFATANTADPVALGMENGERVLIDQLNKETKDALSCLQNEVVPFQVYGATPVKTDSSGTRSFEMKSAYRPTAYQDHLYEIYSKSKELKKYGKECNAVREQVEAQRINHDLGGIVAKTNSRHSSGNGFDMSIKGYSQSQITGLAKKCGLKRLLGVKGEESHFYR